MALLTVKGLIVDGHHEVTGERVKKGIYLQSFFSKGSSLVKGFQSKNYVMVKEANKCEHEGFQFKTIW